MSKLNMLNFDILAIIADYAGVTEQWKHRFSTDVLPKIDQGWMEVGNGNGPNYEFTPCLNCYMYSRSDHGNGRFCMSCTMDEVVESEVVNFDQMKISRSFRIFDNFETFKRYRDVYNYTLIRMNDKILQKSTLFKEIQMLNLV